MRLPEGALRRIGRLLADTGRSLRGHDLALLSAGVTFYAGIALVPGLLVALRLASLLVGVDNLQRLGGSLADALPEALGAPDVAARIVDAGATLGWTSVLITVFPASLYGEGLRRAFLALRGGSDSFTGWRGRLFLLPLLCLAPLLVLAVLVMTPLLADLFRGGDLWRGVLGVFVVQCVDFVVLTVALAYLYRMVAPGRPSAAAQWWGAGITGAFMAGFVQGFVLFLALPLDLGRPFGGWTYLGGVVAVGFWLWFLHILTLVGYALTWQLESRGGSPVGSPAPRTTPARPTASAT